MLRVSAIAGAAAVSMLAIAPTFAAAAPVSQATASGLTLGILGNPLSTGTVKATNDGTTETKTGQVNPPISVLNSQSIVKAGVVAQEAKASVTGDNGTSAACAGLAGQGATIAEVGDSSCLTGGNAVDLDLGNIDLTKVVVINPNSVLGPLSALNGLLGNLLAPVTTALSGALANTPLNGVGLSVGLGVTEARCTATPTALTGAANIGDIKVDLNLPAPVGKINLVTLPIQPDHPNTPDVNVDLTSLTTPLLNAIQAQLSTALNGVLDPANVLVKAVRDQILATVLPQLSSALAPLTTQILSLKLWQEDRTANTIDVKALQLKVLPALATAGVSSLASLDIGHVTCGPNGKRTVNPPTTTPTDGPPDVPTVVDSGVNGSNTARDVLTATAALMLLAGTAGLIGYRRMLTK
ncbi:MAG: hypothetical protein ACJ72D_10920 [Marmoricola sp.]